MATIGRRGTQLATRALLSSSPLDETLKSLFSRPPKVDSFSGADAREAHGLRRSIGTARGGGPEIDRIKKLGARALPPYPGSALIAQLEVPPPACLKDSHTVQSVMMLGAAYRSAVRVRFQTNSQFLLHGDPAKHKSFKMLQESAASMWLRAVPPAAWVLFSFDVWKSTINSNPKRPPPTSWVFSPKRIGSRFEWFEDLRTEYCRRRVSLAPIHESLLATWDRMWRSLLVERPDSREALLEIVDRFFPEDTFEKQVASAKSEVFRLQAQIDSRIQEGANLSGALWE